MRKVILGLAVSLDGYIEGPNGEYDWCFTDQDYGMSDFMNRIDAVFYGRKSYEMMLAAGADVPETSWSWGDKKSYIFSNTIKKAPQGTELVKGDIISAVRKIKSEPGKDIWLFGGASLMRSLLEEGMIDEIGMAIHPILLGKGKRLFSETDKRVKLNLIDSKAYNTGLIYVTYEVMR